jgi:hypothetical protein
MVDTGLNALFMHMMMQSLVAQNQMASRNHHDKIAFPVLKKATEFSQWKLKMQSILSGKKWRRILDQTCEPPNYTAISVELSN